MLRRLARTRALSAEHADTALAYHLALPLTLHEIRPMAVRIWSLRENFGPNDACYVALAEALGARFLTTDGSLARATAQHTDVEVLGL